MHSIRVQCSADLSELLKPLREKLDAAWWYLNGYGIHLERLLHETEGLVAPASLKSGSKQELAEWLQKNQDWLKAHDQQMSRVIDEYECWMDDSAGFRVGLPGWFSRYVDYAETCWAGYVACESATGDRPEAALALVNQSDPAWEQTPASFAFPQEVIFACKNVDDAWWDFFFRDKEDLQSTQAGRKSSGSNPVPRTRDD